jgi:hypothetical protein
VKIETSLLARLAFLARVTQKECVHLQATNQRLFEDLFTIERAEQLDIDQDLSERLDAFVSRFGRLQDTVGDKLIPALLAAMGERPSSVIDNLDKAEKFSLIASADIWMEMRKLRNQMVHEYIEDLGILCSALRTGHAYVPDMINAAHACIALANKLMRT